MEKSVCRTPAKPPYAAFGPSPIAAHPARAASTAPTPFIAEAALQTAFLRLGDALIGDFDVPEFLDTLAARCSGLDEVAAAGVTMSDETGGFTLHGATHEFARALESVQHNSGHGPLIDCHRTGVQAHYWDLASTPWPRFADAVSALGYRSLLGVPLRLRSTRLGAITLYGEAAGPWSRATIELAQALADIATMSVLLQRASVVRATAIDRLESMWNSRAGDHD